MLDGHRRRRRPRACRVKINAVALKGFNEDELFPSSTGAPTAAIDLTFIEVMPMGDIGNEDRLDQYWSLKDLRARLAERFTLTDLAERTGGPARYVRLDGDRPEDRLHHAAHPQFLRKLQPRAADLHRASSTCASGRRTWPTSARPSAPAPTTRVLEEAIRAAIARKPKGHDFDYSRQTVAGQVTRHMSHTGG